MGCAIAQLWPYRLRDKLPVIRVDHITSTICSSPPMPVKLDYGSIKTANAFNASNYIKIRPSTFASNIPYEA